MNIKFLRTQSFKNFLHNTKKNNKFTSLNIFIYIFCSFYKHIKVQFYKDLNPLFMLVCVCVLS